MTRQELEERLLDYLYDELEPSARAAFERALPQHPELAREVTAHQATRRAFQTMPREAVPAGLLNEVLAEADKEAARRGGEASSSPVMAKRAVAASDSSPGFWERVRRFLSQPAFAMAMVVAVVAGVSVVGSKKGDLPGMPASSEAQRLPTVGPVVMNDRAQGELGQRTPVDFESTAAAPANADEPAVEPQEDPPTVDLALLDKGQEAEEASDDLRAAEAKPKALSATKADEQRGRKEGSLDGERGEAAKTQPAVAADKVAAGRTTGEPQEVPGGASGPGVAKPPEKPAEKKKETGGPAAGFAGDLSEDTARDGTVATPKAPDAGLDDSTRSKSDKAGTEPSPKDVAPAPVVTPATSPTDTKPKQANDLEAEKAKSDPPAREESAPAEPAKPAKIVTTEQAGTHQPAPEIDDDRKDASKAPVPGLSPPAPTPDKVWTTYQQQLAAGALADAERSVEALAKLEGESTRVRQARAEVKKRMEAQKQSVTPSPSKVPPDPPVQPPK